jgi:polysaccharide export outer membrane protein
MSLMRRVTKGVRMRGGVRGKGYVRTSATLALAGMLAGMLSPTGVVAQGTGSAQGSGNAQGTGAQAAPGAAVASNPKPAGVAAPVEPSGPTVPPDYRVGMEDIFTVKVWEDDRITGKVIVGPDGTVSLPLVNSIRAVGLTFEQFRQAIIEAAQKYVVGAVTVTLQLEQINSRKVYISGEVVKRGVYPLVVPLTVSQMIVVAGGVTEYANKKKVVVNRVENGKKISFTINYDDISKGKNLDKDIELKPGDVITVP